jgi:hypothetical protein
VGLGVGTPAVGIFAGAALSGMLSLVCISVNMTESPHLMFPLVENLMPRFVAGDVHNLLAPAGHGGLVSLLCLPFLWGLVTLALRGVGTRSGSLRVQSL